MTIEFEDLGGGGGDTGEGKARLRIGARGFAVAGLAYGRAYLRLGATSAGAPEEPELPTYSAGIGSIFIQATGYTPPTFTDADAQGAARLALRARGFEAATHGEAGLRLRARGSQFFDPSPGSDTQAAAIYDTLAMGSTIGLLPTAVLKTLLAMGVDPQTTYDGKNVLVDRIAFADPLHFVVVVMLEEGLVFGDQVTPSFTTFVRVVSRLLLSGSAENYAEAYIQILDSLVLRALADALNKVEVTDTLAMGERVSSLYTLYAALLEKLVLAGTATPEYLATVVIEERLLLGANLSHEADLAVLIRDSIGFATTLTIDNGEYIAWVLNTEGNKALTRYTNYPFNSFARIGGRYYGAGSDGIHRLEGEDDNGVDIKAMLRMGLTDMGTRKLKRVPEAFIGISTDGTILMKVITISEDTGEKQAAIYKMRVRGAAATRENRIQFGKGMKSVDWDWVIENVAGADFDLRSIEFRPIILDRRTRG